MNTKVKTWVGMVVIIILVITIGVFTWKIIKFKQGMRAQQVLQTQTSVPNQTAEEKKTISQTVVTDNQSYIEVKELGFKIPIDSSVISDITYKIMPGGDGYSSAAFSLKSLNALSAGCADGTAVISKINGTPQKNATGESEFYLGRMADIKQFDGYFLLFAGPQDSCSVGKHTDLESKVVQIISGGFRDISLIDKNDTISDWQTYRNEKLGFEMKIPVNVDDGPIKVIENGNIVWVVAENGYDYKENINQMQSSVSEFEKVQGVSWAMIVKTVNSDQELDKFIKDRYGKQCKIEEKNYSSQEGIYDVSVNTSSVEPDDGTGCFLNWMVAIKYSPSKKIAAIWDMGQDNGFVYSAKLDSYGNPVMYDPEMFTSFKFIK